MGIIFGRTQTADQTPFDATHADAIAEGLSSTDVFSAIIEAKRDAINNDRYPVQFQWNAQANAGRYLESFNNRSTDSAPLIPPEASKIVAYSFAAIAASTGTIEIFNLTTNTVLLTITFNNELLKSVTGINVLGIAAGDKIAVRVGSGSIQSPFGRIWFNTIT